MSETQAPYVITPTMRPAVIVAEVQPLDPRVRALVIGLRRVCLLLADVLGEFAGLPKRD